jgi:hypothetical protein
MYQSVCSKAAKLFLFQPSRYPTVRVRRPIGFRTPPNQIPFAAQSDCVRRPIGLRSQNDDFC